MLGTGAPGSYHERLWPGPLGWLLVAGFAVFAYVALAPADPGVAAVAAALTLVAAVVVVARTTAVVAVRDGELRAGRAHIPVELLGSGQVLDAAAVRRALGPGSDARTYACVRAWLPGAVLLEVVDPQDPTPAWLVSSRRPQALLDAVRSAQGRAQAAHSVQII